MCTKCKRPTVHGYLRTDPVESKLARRSIRIILFYEHLFECSKCLSLRRYGIEGGETDASVARLRAIPNTYRNLGGVNLCSAHKISNCVDCWGVVGEPESGKPIIKVVEEDDGNN